ncbi:MAG TPA: hypothetical protein PK677_01645 [Acidiphilium sp.]|nr:hypothetical protein [Acidiphilium sp.]
MNTKKLFYIISEFWILIVFFGRADASQHLSKKVLVKISSQDIPYKGESGTYEQIYTIKLPFGQLIIRTNIDNGTILFLKKNGNKIQKLYFATIAHSSAPSVFYGQNLNNKNETATIFKRGNDYFIPVEASPGGACNYGNDIYIVKWAKGSNPSISQMAKLDSNGCLESDYVGRKKSSLAVSIFSGDSLKIENWRYFYIKGDMHRHNFSLYQSSPGYIPLVSAKRPAVRSIMTRYGNLTLGRSNVVLLNGTIQKFPDDADSYEGFASRVFQDGDKDIVVALAEPDMATGQVFQILTISPTTINLSRYFGSSFSYISYKFSGKNIFLDVGKYKFEPPGFSNDHFEIKEGGLIGLDTQPDTVVSENLPVNISIISNTWYTLTNSNECIIAPYSPADLIKRDRINALQDNVRILSSGKGGLPIVVQVAEPTSGDLEIMTMFFRGYGPCVQYRKMQAAQIKELQ